MDSQNIVAIILIAVFIVGGFFLMKVSTGSGQQAPPEEQTGKK